MIGLTMNILNENNMDAFEFISNYNKYVEEIEQVIKPELLLVLEELKLIDPHDLVTPETWFARTSHARGFVWSLFISKCKLD
jgi:hypothetical protein